MSEIYHMNAYRHMRNSLKCCSIALIAGLGVLASTGARADVIAVGAVVGPSTVAFEDCYLYNAGTNPIRINSAVITGEDGTTPSFTFNSCGTFPRTLNPGGICGVNTHQTKHQAWACRFVTQGSTPNVRGVFDLRNSSNETLFIVPMSSNTRGF